MKNTNEQIEKKIGSKKKTGNWDRTFELNFSNRSDKFVHPSLPHYKFKTMNVIYFKYLHNIYILFELYVCCVLSHANG